MTNANLSTRTFQLWEYRVSHGSLLIRSPQVESEGIATNIDIVCTGVEFISLPRFLHGLEILEARTDEVHSMETILDKKLSPISVRIISSMGQRFPIVAASLKVEENRKEIFESPFD